MFKRLGHMAIRVKDYDTAIPFYRDILGMEEAFRMHNGPGGGLSTVYLCFAPGQFLEMFFGGWKEQPPITENTRGYSHLCIEVEDAAKTLEAEERHEQKCCCNSHREGACMFYVGVND